MLVCQANILTNVDQVLVQHMASPGIKELIGQSDIP